MTEIIAWGLAALGWGMWALERYHKSTADKLDAGLSNAATRAEQAARDAMTRSKK